MLAKRVKRRNVMNRLCIVLSLVVALLSAQSAMANLVVNGGFETGTFTGWSLDGNANTSTRVSDVIYDPSYLHVHSGTYGVVSGPWPPDVYLSQNLNTNTGQSYVVDFWLASSTGVSNSFTVFWNGISLYNLSNSNPLPFTEFTFTVTGTGNDILKFGMNNPPGAWGLDDVNVTESSVPEPSTFILLGAGIGGLALLRRKARKQ
jgi:hypothetical protein